MAPEIDGNRQAGDVGWKSLDVHGQCRDAPAITLRSNPERVDAVEEIAFEPSQIGFGIPLIDWSQNRLLRKDRGSFKRAADADPDNDRWTGVRACAIDRVDN